MSQRTRCWVKLWKENCLSCHRNNLEHVCEETGAVQESRGDLEERHWNWWKLRRVEIGHLSGAKLQSQLGSRGGVQYPRLQSLS